MTPTTVRKAVGALRLSAGLYWSKSLGLRAEKAGQPERPAARERPCWWTNRRLPV